ncbi:hypothetical protein QFC20_005325 [Naganishia adeliensis]|uniref:Uncharacterized protein n=1 Tax=Naganishia adeliensis TaxID=92952 RepID=A0ACC2VP72_9TREE|nr:hypothetical protein QFC20_005325 [Naganishia adeliensis]
MSLAGPPIIPTELQTYDSYATDPKYQRYYTHAWTAFTATCILGSVPYLVRAFGNGYWRKGYMVNERVGAVAGTEKTIIEGKDREQCCNDADETPITPAPPRRYAVHSRLLITLHACAQSLFSGTLPIPTVDLSPRFLGRLIKEGGTQLADCCRKGYIGLTVGQVIIVAAYTAGVILCSVQGAQLKFNANRPGFLALAQLIPVILLSTKNNPLGLLLGLGYEKLNWAHRWSGRLLWLCATLHMALWVDQYRRTGQLKVLASSENKYGIAAYVLLCALAVFSVRPARRRFYEVFYALHVASFVGFMVTVCYHTNYSRPWVWPCVALYALDLLLRAFRYRFKDALLVPLDETMTMIHIPDCDAGWLPTQHVHLRILVGARVFESHAFTITNAPASAHTGGAVVGAPAMRGITLYAKVTGDWTRAVNALARAPGYKLVGGEDDEEGTLVRESVTSVRVLLSGPYGGLKLDMASYGSVLLIAGGSGVTFMLGCIEECLTRKRELRTSGRAGEGPRKVESTIESMAPTLAYLAALASTSGFQLIYHLYLTHPPRPLPSGPPPSLPATTTLAPYRPAISQLVREALPPPTFPELEEGRTKTCCTHGGLAVVACGPEGIVTESRNAVAVLGIGERVRCGGVDFHGECYTL